MQPKIYIGGWVVSKEVLLNNSAEFFQGLTKWLKPMWHF